MLRLGTLTLMPVGLRDGSVEGVCTVGTGDCGVANDVFSAGRLSDAKLGAGNIGPGATAELLLGAYGLELLEVEGAESDGNGSGSIIGISVMIAIGMIVGELILRLGAERGNPSDGILTEGTLKDGKPVAGGEILRLGDGIVRDGIARVGIASDKMLKDGTLIVGSEMLILGGGIVRDGITNGGMLKDGAGTLSTLFEGVLKMGRAVGVAGKLMIGRPKESALGGVIGIISMVGDGMTNGGGPVIVGGAIDDKLRGGTERLGIVAEGRLIDARLADGTVTDGILIDESANVPRLVTGVTNVG